MYREALALRYNSGKFHVPRNSSNIFKYCVITHQNLMYQEALAIYLRIAYNLGKLRVPRRSSNIFKDCVITQENQEALAISLLLKIA